MKDLAIKIHLVRSNEVTPERLSALVKLMGHYPGPAEFIPGKNKVQLRLDMDDEFISWSSIWAHCKEYRDEHHVPEEDAVVILTDLPNKKNWFSSGLEDEKKNFFVRTDEKDWSKYVEAPWIYPTASELASIALALGSFTNLDQIKDIAHDPSRGCIFDYCKNKYDIRLRLRTADICMECRNKLTELKVDPSLLRQVFAIMEGIRVQMLFRERLNILDKPSSIVIDCRNKTLKFPEFGNITLQFNEQQMMIYHFFLNHPKGIYFIDLTNHKDELKQLYMEYKGTVLLTEIMNDIENLINQKEKTKKEIKQLEKMKKEKMKIEKYDLAVENIIGQSNSALSSIISSINKIITKNIDPSIKDKYCILIDKKHKIALDQNLISFINNLYF